MAPLTENAHPLVRRARPAVRMNPKPSEKPVSWEALRSFFYAQLRANAKVFGIAALLCSLWLFMSFTVPGSFLLSNNIENLLRRTALFGILGIGVAFVIITAGIDLSIGSVVCLAGCLLALFLAVDYEPFDVQSVIEVRSTEKAVVIAGRVQGFEVGDQVRYFGGRRARNFMARVTSVASIRVGQPGESQVDATEIRFDVAPSNDDTYGKLAKFYEITEFRHETQVGPSTAPATITIAGDHSRLEFRDQVTLVHPKSGLKQLPVVKVEVRKTATVVTLKSGLGSKFSGEWVAIPIERRQRMPVAVGVGLVLLIGLGLGCLHGLLVTKLGLQPFVVTLCGLLVYRGVSRRLVNDQVQGFGNEYNESLSVLAQGKWEWSADGFGVPYPFFILMLLALCAAVFLNRTVWGRYMQALGRNVEATRYSGINTDRMTVLAYMVCTGLAAIGGMLFALDSNSVSPSSFGSFFELHAIAAAVLGGCSLRGGAGGILGVVIGTAVMQTLNNMIVLEGISDTLEDAVIGLVLLLGVVADVLLKRMIAKRRARAEARRAWGE